jgi:hypothetical protein
MKKLLKELKRKWYYLNPYGLNDKTVFSFSDCKNLKEDLVDIVYYNRHPIKQEFVLIELEEDYRRSSIILLYTKRNSIFHITVKKYF